MMTKFTSKHNTMADFAQINQIYSQSNPGVQVPTILGADSSLHMINPSVLRAFGNTSVDQLNAKY
jgi:hypothetical protein